MGSWVKDRAKQLADRIWDYDDTQMGPPLLDDEIERAVRETVEQAAKRVELGMCTPHPMMGGLCDHQGCAAQRIAAALVRAMLQDPADDVHEVPGG